MSSLPPEDQVSDDLAEKIVQIIGRDARPIAVGTALRRLVSKVHNSDPRSARAVQQVLVPVGQLGVGVSGGVEQVVHEMRYSWEDENRTAGQVTVISDFKNAFNAASRPQLLSAVYKAIPESGGWWYFCYGRPAPLFLSDGNVIWSKTGGQQGDPGMSLGFSLLVAPLLKKMMEAAPNGKIKAILDDITTTADAHEAAAATKVLLEYGPEIGLFPNLSKFKIIGDNITPGMFDDRITNVCPAPTETDGFMTLNVPIGGPRYCADALKNKVDSIRKLFSKVATLNSKHTAMTLLRNCVSASRITYWMRTVPPSYIREELRVLDDLIRSTLDDTLGFGHSDTQWQQARLAVRSGGHGLRSCTDHSPGAYVASSTAWLVADDAREGRRLECSQMTRATREWEAVIHEYDGAGVTKEITDGIKQKDLSDCVDAAIATNLKKHLKEEDPEHYAKFLSISSKRGASAWLTVRPDRKARTTLTNHELAISCKLRVGQKIFTNPGPKCTMCGAVGGANEYHALTCKCFIPTRHWYINSAVYELCREAGLPAVKELKHLKGPKYRKRPADTFLPGFGGGLGTCIDVACTNVWRDVNRSAATMKGGGAADRYCTVQKEAANNHNRNDALAMGYDYQPLVVDSAGAWDANAVTWLRKLGGMLATATNISHTHGCARVFSRLSTTLQRQQAHAILERRPYATGGADAIDEELLDAQLHDGPEELVDRADNWPALTDEDITDSDDDSPGLGLHF